MTGQKEQIAAILALAEKMDRRLAAQFVAGVQNIRNQLDLKRLTELIEIGNYAAVVEMVNMEMVNEGMAGFTQALTDAFVAGGTLSASFAPPVLTNATTGVRTIVAFDVANPALTGVLRDYRYGKIQEITADIRETIKTVLADNIAQGIGPIQSARNIRGAIGLTSHQEKAVENYRFMLENMPKQSLQRELRDRRFDRTIDRAAREKKALPPEQIDKMVNRYREKYLKHRSEVIARTESIRALNMSNYQLWFNMVAEGKIEAERLKRFWIYTKDGRTRYSHRQIPSLNKDGVGMNESFKSPLGLIRYPGDPAAGPANSINCRCTVFTRIVE